MTLLELLIFVVLVLVAFWIIGLMALDPPAAKLLRIAVGAVALVYLLYALGAGGLLTTRLTR